MVLAVVDICADIYQQTGDFTSQLHPYSINKILTKEELESYNLFQGSGGSVSYIRPISLTGSKTEVKTTKLETLESVVTEIMTTFKLTKNEELNVFQVKSRKTLYNWIDGKVKPRRSAMNRIFDLLVIARDWRSAGLKASNESLRQPILLNNSILDLLSEDLLDRERIVFAGSRLNNMLEKPNSIADPFA